MADQKTYELLPNEVLAFQQLRGHLRVTLEQLGELDIKKAQKIAEYANIEGQAQQLLTQCGERLGIPKGTHWSAEPDGTINILNIPTQEAPSEEPSKA